MTPDTSVVVAAFARWHLRHDDAQRAVRNSDRLIAHVGLEAFSVLTRLPAPHRAPAGLVRTFLARHWPAPWLTLDGKQYTELLAQADAATVSGGSVYDALIASAAREHGHGIVSLDQRAARTYQALAARYELL